jgi:hypothetical protein
MTDYKQLAQELYETLKELSDYLDYEKLPLSVAKKLDLYLKTPEELAQKHPTGDSNAL